MVDNAKMQATVKNIYIWISTPSHNRCVRHVAPSICLTSAQALEPSQSYVTGRARCPSSGADNGELRVQRRRPPRALLRRAVPAAGVDPLRADRRARRRLLHRVGGHASPHLPRPAAAHVPAPRRHADGAPVRRRDDARRPALRDGRLRRRRRRGRRECKRGDGVLRPRDGHVDARGGGAAGPRAARLRDDSDDVTGTGRRGGVTGGRHATCHPHSRHARPTSPAIYVRRHATCHPPTHVSPIPHITLPTSPHLSPPPPP